MFLQLARENEHHQIAAHKNMKSSNNGSNSISMTTTSSNVMADPATVQWADDELIEERDDDLLIQDAGNVMRLEIEI